MDEPVAKMTPPTAMVANVDTLSLSLLVLLGLALAAIVVLAKRNNRSVGGPAWNPSQVIHLYTPALVTSFTFDHHRS